MRDRITSHAVVRWVERMMRLDAEVAEARRIVAERQGLPESDVYDGNVLAALEEALPGFDAGKIRDAMLEAGGRFALTSGAATYTVDGVTFCTGKGYITTVVEGKGTNLNRDRYAPG